jgi:hypothetical protein
MRFAFRVTVTLETGSRSCTREHRELMLRGGFAPEHEDNRAHPFKRSSGLSRLYDAREVRRGVADDLARPRDRDATVAAFDPRVEWTEADGAGVPETDDESRFLHSTDDGVWDVTRMQVDCAGVCDCRAALRAESRRRSCMHRGGRSAVRASAAT